MALRGAEGGPEGGRGASKASKTRRSTTTVTVTSTTNPVLTCAGHIGWIGVDLVVPILTAAGGGAVLSGHTVGGAFTAAQRLQQRTVKAHLTG